MKKAQITVEYSEHMGSDLTVVNAARQSFAKQKTEFDPVTDGNLIEFLATGKRQTEWEQFLDEIIGLASATWDAGAPGAFATCDEGRSAIKQRLIEYKREAQHWVPFGHPHVTLRLRMPIFLARQFVKHQVGGVWSEESRRYMSDEPEFYFEPVLQARPDDIKQGAGGEVLGAHAAAFEMEDITAAANDTYQYLLATHQLAPEQAREILTLNTMTGVTWTGSLLFWSRVCNQRLDPHAQGAAQTMARQISGIIEPLFPYSWKALVK